jgi:hypothetical protein
MSDYDFKKLSFYRPGDRIYAQAQQIWMILVGIVITYQLQDMQGRPPTVTYGELAEAMGKDRQAGRTLTRQLWIIGEYCRENGVPTLNSIVVNRETGMPGHDVVLSSGNTAKAEMRNVSRYKWASVRIPSIAAFRDVWDQISE